MGDWPVFWRGVVVGIALLILVYLLLGLTSCCSFAVRRSITIPGENGDLVIIGAVEEFVRQF